MHGATRPLWARPSANLTGNEQVARIHVTVPKDYRMTRDAPVRYRFVHQDLPREDIERLDGLPIVTPKRAIRQAIDDHLRGGLIEQAIDTARNRGLLRRADTDALRRTLAEALRA